MPGSVTNAPQVLPVPAGTEVPAASIAGTGDPGLDGTRAPYTFLLDTSDPAAAVPLLGLAQDGADSSDANATQATAGVGLRGWLSTLVSLFRAGTAKVQVTTLPAGSAQDGTDSTAATALQATAGVGLRGWLSTLVSLKRAAGAVLTTVGASTTAGGVQLVGANAQRKGLIVVNDSTAALFIAYAGTASATAYSYYVPGSQSGVPYTWEAPQPIYTGAIWALWSAANGAGRVTETS